MAGGTRSGRRLLRASARTLVAAALGTGAATRARSSGPQPPPRPTHPRAPSGAVPVEAVEVHAYTVPTDGHESDGTLEWDETTLVVVHARAGGARGIGYTYADVSAAKLVHGKLAGVVRGRDALDVTAANGAMRRAVRNLSRRGLASFALSAVDAALWDLKAKLLGLPVARLLGAVREGVPGYGSGGFTSYDVGRLTGQLAGWVEEGFRRVKMKIGRDPGEDDARVAAVRQAIGAGPELFVDANGAYQPKEALAHAGAFADLGVTYFEEPVSMEDLPGLRLVRERLPPPIALASGEYATDLFDFRGLLAGEAVDVLQADATRCGGPTGFLGAAALAEAWNRPLSAHCAPSLHVPLMLAAPTGAHLEWFHDHVRLERMLFDGAPRAERGVLRADLDRPGFGFELREADARRFEVS